MGIIMKPGLAARPPPPSHSPRPPPPAPRPPPSPGRPRCSPSATGCSAAAATARSAERAVLRYELLVTRNPQLRQVSYRCSQFRTKDSHVRFSRGQARLQSRRGQASLTTHSSLSPPGLSARESPLVLWFSSSSSSTRSLCHCLPCLPACPACLALRPLPSTRVEVPASRVGLR